MSHEREYFPQIILQDIRVATFSQLTMQDWKPPFITKSQAEDAHHIFGVAIHRTWKTLHLPSISIADEKQARIELTRLKMNGKQQSFHKAAQHYILMSLRSSEEFTAAPESCFSKALEIHKGKLLMASELTWAVFGEYVARGSMELAEGDPSAIYRKQQPNRCCLLENGGLTERWNFLLSMITPKIPEQITLDVWTNIKTDIRRRILSKFYVLYCCDLGQRLNEENRSKHAHKDGDGGLRGPLRATQINRETNTTTTKRKRSE